MSSAAAPLPLTSSSNPIDIETVKIARSQKITYFFFEIVNFRLGCLKIKPVKLTLNHKSDICHWRKKSKLLAGEDEWRMHWLVVAHWHQCALTRPHPSFITILFWICICICNWVCPHSSFITILIWICTCYGICIRVCIGIRVFAHWHRCPLTRPHPSFITIPIDRFQPLQKCLLTFFWVFLPPDINNGPWPVSDYSTITAQQRRTPETWMCIS